MVNQTFYNLGTAPSVIRQLFAYGLEQAKLVGPENVFDYSLGNPSNPAPKKVNASIHKIVAVRVDAVFTPESTVSTQPRETSTSLSN